MQPLIRDQVLALTGQRFLGDYTSDEQQYRALMDTGLTYAKAHNLRPGIALSAAQMAQLTADIVWLVEQSVTLADGSRQKVLVPQVYVRVQPGDLNGSGTLLAGRQVDIKLTGDLTNSGTIAGRKVVQISADNIHNLAGLIRGDAVSVAAKTDLNNIGGTIQAQSQLIATAGRDINIETTTQSQTRTAGQSSFSRTNIDRVAGLYVTGNNGTLLASAGRDVNIIAGVILNGNASNANGTSGTPNATTVIAAGRDINLATVQVAQQEDSTRNSTNFLRQGTTQDVGSVLQTAGNMTLQAGNDITAKAAGVQASGALSLAAARNITLASGEQTSNTSEARSHRNASGLGSTSRTLRQSQESTTAIGSSLEGNTVLMQAGNNIHVIGSSVASNEGTALLAGNNLIVESAQNTTSTSRFEENSKTGLMTSGSLSNPNSLGFDLKRGTSNTTTRSSTAQAGSSITSASGNTTLIADKGVLAVIASNVSAAPDKTLTLQGAQVYLSGGLNSEETTSQAKQNATNIHAGFVKPSEGILSRGGVKGTGSSTSLAATTLSGGNIDIRATGTPGKNADGSPALSGISLAGVKLSTPGELNLDAGDGKLAFNILQTTTSTSQETTQRDLVYQKAQGEGTTSSEAVYNELNYAKLTTKSAGGVTVQQATSAGTKGALTPATLNDLASQPGLSWINDVQRQSVELARTNPAAALHIERVQLAHDQWDYKQQGLTKEGAIIVAVVVAYFTAGAASGAVGTATTTAGVTTTTAAGTTLATTTAAGVTTYTAAGAALNAGFSSLATQASISFINNNGNIGATLDQLGSSDSIRQTVAAMLTAGVGAGLPSNSLTGVAAQTATGCATGAMTGIGCERGATNAAITSGAAFVYTNTVGYAANAGPGFQVDDPVYVVDRTPGSPVYGQQPIASQGANVIGLNRPGAFFSQGGTTSNLPNNVPFINATAGFHDWLFNGNQTLNDWFNVLNVPTMIPAAFIAIPAALNNPSLSWMFFNGSPYTLNTYPRPPAIPSVVRLPAIEAPQSANVPFNSGSNK